jgi:DNA-binding response OmpR family regulator
MHTPPRILIVDDNETNRDILATRLGAHGYDLKQAADGEEALAAAKKHLPDLILLDVMMPKLDGFSVLERVREFTSTPVIMLTARGQDQDKIRGLDLGADDYLTKPFSVDELLARVRAVLRRAQLQAADAGHGATARLTIGEMTIDLAQHQVMMRGAEVQLTPIEYRLLAYLAQNAGRVVTQDLLLEHVWGAEYVGESHLLQVNVNRLRHKIERDAGRPAYLLTKPGIGYLLPSQPNITPKDAGGSR